MPGQQGQQGELPVFQGGGTLRPGSLYIERPADKELPRALLAGELCYVLAPRQAGKSSLAQRCRSLLQEKKVRTVFLDLSGIGSSGVTPEDWYFVLIEKVARQLKLKDTVAFWETVQNLPPLQRWRSFLYEKVLGQDLWPVVIFLDEIDSLFSLEFSRDDFLASIREMYNSRAKDKAWNRLTFCLMGVAAPGDLIQDPRCTPFNVGRRIRLRDFTPQESEQFLPGLFAATGEEGAKSLLAAILEWTNGYPYMTHRLCQLFVEERATGSGREKEWLELAVRQYFLQRGGANDPLLSYINKQFDWRFKGKKAAELLYLYRRVLEEERIPVQVEEERHFQLQVIGLVAERQWGEEYWLEARNQIVASVFDLDWVKEKLAKRRLAEPVAHWLKESKATKELPVFEQVDEFLQWAQGKSLSPEEQEFLRAATEKRRKRERQILLRFSAAAVAIVVVLWALSASWLYLEKGKALEQVHRVQRELGQAVRDKEEAQKRVQTLQKKQKDVEKELNQSELIKKTLEKQAEQTKKKLHQLRQEWKKAKKNEQKIQQRAQEIAQEEKVKEKELALIRRERKFLLVEQKKSRFQKIKLHQEMKWLEVQEKKLQSRLQRLGQEKREVVKRVEQARKNREVVSGRLRRLQKQERWLKQKLQKLTQRKDKLEGELRRLSQTMKRIDLRLQEAQKKEGKVLQRLKQILKATAQARKAVARAQKRERDSRSFLARVWRRRRRERARQLRARTRLRREIKKLRWKKGALLRELRKLQQTIARAQRRRKKAQLDEEAIRQKLRQSRRALLEKTGKLPSVLSPSWSQRGPKKAASSLLEVLQDDREEALVLAVRMLSSLREAGGSPSSALRQAVQKVVRRLRYSRSLREKNSLVRAAAFSPDGRYLATASNKGTVQLRDGQSGRWLRTLRGHKKGVAALLFSPDSRTLVTASHDHTARIWSVSTGRSLQALHHPGPVNFLAFSRRGQRLASATSRHVFVWKTGKVKRLAQMKFAYRIKALALSPGGKRVAVGTWGGASLWFIGQTRPLKLKGHLGAVYDVAFSPGGRLLATAGYDKTARLFKAQSGLLLRTLKDHQGVVASVRFSKSGDRLVTASDDRTVRLWKAKNGKLIQILLGHQGKVNEAVFARKDRWVVSSSDDRTVRLWERGWLRFELKGHRDIVKQAKVDPQGSRVVTVGGDGSARLWDPATLSNKGSPKTKGKSLLAQACQLLQIRSPSNRPSFKEHCTSKTK